jgi:hypothetical protein
VLPAGDWSGSAGCGRRRLRRGDDAVGMEKAGRVFVAGGRDAVGVGEACVWRAETVVGWIGVWWAGGGKSW